MSRCKLYNLSSIESEDKSSGALFPGVALATVTNRDQLDNGQVKIKFHWRKDEIDARVVTPTKDTPPPIEVHDKVLVAFEQNNFEFPFVIGFIYPIRKDTET